MRVEMTQAQAVMIATNAINASIPVGMGFLQHEQKDYEPEDIEECFDEKGNAYFDYFKGRMVKTNFKKDGKFYKFNDGGPRSDYQSWASKYPTYVDLVKSVIADPVIQTALEQ